MAALRHAGWPCLPFAPRRDADLHRIARGRRDFRFRAPRRMTRDERALRELPAWLWFALALALAAQLAWRAHGPSPSVREADLPSAPSAAALRLSSFGEPEAAARLAMLYLQAFDYGGANATPYRRLDYGRLIDWLSAILELDPRSDYPLFAAARIYAENPDLAKSRLALELVYRAFFADPDGRWAALAHAA